MLHRLPPPAVIALAVTATACSAPETDEPTGTARAAVVGGVLSGPEDDGIVDLFAVKTGQTDQCSGSLIAPDLVLTARHCVSYFTDGSFTCSQDGQLQNSVGGAGVMNEPIPAANISICTGGDCRPTSAGDAGPVAFGKQIFRLPTDSICQNDIAIVWLDRALDQPIVPIRLTTATTPGETLRVVGYGQGDQGVRNLRNSRSGVAVLAVAASPLYPSGGLAPHGTFVVGPGPCQGDSGGPALSEPADPSQPGEVAGVYSIVGLPCTSSTARNYYTQVAVFQDFVVNAFATAGYTIDAGTAGAGGAGGAEGGSGDVAGSAGMAGSSGAVAHHGLRKKGGCTCNTPGGVRGAFELLTLLPLVAFGVRRRSMRRAQPQRV